MALHRVSVWRLRHLFNASGYWQKTQAGQLTAAIKRSNHPTLAEAKQPFCTKTQTVVYLDANDSEVARVHQYLKPDGTLGGHGYPDPKYVIIAGVKYAAKTPPKNLVGRILFHPLEWFSRIKYKIFR